MDGSSWKVEKRMTPQQRHNLANFITIFIKRQIESLVNHTVNNLESLHNLHDMELLSLDFSINIPGWQYKQIINGEVDPLEMDTPPIQKNVLGNRHIRIDNGE